MAEESEKKPKAGWYVDKRWPDEQRRWDGTKWLDHWRPVPQSAGERPEAFMLGGVILALILGLVTFACFSADEQLGWWALWFSAAIAGTVFNIGVIAKAVEVGVRAAHR